MTVVKLCESPESCGPVKALKETLAAMERVTKERDVLREAAQAIDNHVGSPLIAAEIDRLDRASAVCHRTEPGVPTSGPPQPQE